MLKNTNSKKLALYKNTVRTLSGDELASVDGGLTRVQPPNGNTSSNTCNGTSDPKCLCNSCF